VELSILKISPADGRALRSDCPSPVDLRAPYRLSRATHVATWPFGPRLRCRRFTRRRSFFPQTRSASRPHARPSQLLDELVPGSRPGRDGRGAISTGAELPRLQALALCRYLLTFLRSPTTVLGTATVRMTSVKRGASSHRSCIRPRSSDARASFLAVMGLQSVCTATSAPRWSAARLVPRTLSPRTFHSGDAGVTRRLNIHVVLVVRGALITFNVFTLAVMVMLVL
jgi:hypothetical protein